MKENRNGIYATLILLFISILGAAAITYDARLSALFIHSEFIVNCFLGIFTGAFLSFIISTINYLVEKRRILTEYANMINCLNITIIPIYNLYKKGKRNLEFEITIVMTIYNFLFENLHMKPCIVCFVLPHTKIEKKIDEMVSMTVELYKKLVKVKMEIDGYKFSMVSQDDLEIVLGEFFDYLRNYKDDDLFTNVLTDKHTELLKLAKLQYAHDGKLNI